MSTKSRLITAFLLASMLSAAALRAGYYEDGRHFYIKKNYTKAKEMFLKAADPGGSGDAYYFLGEIEKLQGNYREAEEYYKAAISKKNISRQYLINSYWNALVMAEQRNDYDNVVAICRSMWIRTGDASARQKIDSLVNKLLWTDNAEAIAKYNEGAELKKNGKPVEARELFREALGMDRSFLAPKFELGMYAYNSGELDQASDYLGDIASKIPFYAEVQQVLADIQFDRRNYRNAISHYDKTLEYGFMDAATEYRIRIKRGTCYYNIDDYPNAEKDIDKAFKYNSRSAEATLLLSAIKIKLEKYDEALKTLQRANSADPDNPEIQYQIGSIYYRGNDSRYVTYFDALFKISGAKKDRPAKYTKVFVILAKRHFETKNYKRVATILDSLDEKSQTFDTRLLSAKSHFNMKNYDTAIDQFEKLSLSNDDKFILCKAYALSGRREKAKMTLSELAAAGDYLSRAKNDPVLAKLAGEIEDGSKKPEPEKTEPPAIKTEKKETKKTAPVESTKEKQDEEESLEDDDYDR